MMFGRKAPAGYVGPWWGARAIYERGMIDLVANRQENEPDASKAEREALHRWLNEGGALAELRKLVKAHYLPSDSREVLSIERDGYRIECSPQGSHGYMYLGAWKLS